MIQYGIDYGEGYEKATEPGPDVEFLYRNKWYERKVQKDNLCSGYIYRKPVKPKEKEMNEKKDSVEVSGVTITIEGIRLSFDQIEKAYAEAQRIKAENEIKEGDWVFYESQKLIIKVESVTDLKYTGTNGFHGIKSRSTKITNPTHIQALNEIYEGMK